MINTLNSKRSTTIKAKSKAKLNQMVLKLTTSVLRPLISVPVNAYFRILEFRVSQRSPMHRLYRECKVDKRRSQSVKCLWVTKQCQD